LGSIKASISFFINSGTQIQRNVNKTRSWEPKEREELEKENGSHWIKELYFNVDCR